jgi:hypothetical protein
MANFGIGAKKKIIVKFKVKELINVDEIIK